MKRTLISLATIVFLATIPTSISLAADGKPKENREDSVKKALRTIPFRGRIDALDAQKKTIKVGERVFQVTAETKIMKAGKPASFDDAKTGEQVGGAYSEATDSKLLLSSLRLGAKPERPARPAK